MKMTTEPSLSKYNQLPAVLIAFCSFIYLFYLSLEYWWNDSDTFTVFSEYVYIVN